MVDGVEKTILVGVYQELGLLRGQVDMLISQMGSAVSSRNELHAKIERVDEDLQGRIEALRITIGPLPSIIARLEPIVQDLNQQRQQVIGAAWIIKTLWIGIAASGGALTAIIIRKLGWG